MVLKEFGIIGEKQEMASPKEHGFGLEKRMSEAVVEVRKLRRELGFDEEVEKIRAECKRLAEEMRRRQHV